jgi:hypothetical protein
MDYAAFVESLATSEPELSRTLRPFRTLEHVLNWLNSEQYDLRQLDMVTQDEYCHDLFFPLPGRSDYLVLAMT